MCAYLSRFQSLVRENSFCNCQFCPSGAYFLTSVSIARSRKLLLQLRFSRTRGAILRCFNRSFAKNPSATPPAASSPIRLPCFNRSFAKIPSATGLQPPQNSLVQVFQSLVRRNSFCNISYRGRRSVSVPSFNRSFAKTPSATTITTKWDGSYPRFQSLVRENSFCNIYTAIVHYDSNKTGFNRSFAKTPSATRLHNNCNLLSRQFQSLVRENSFCNPLLSRLQPLYPLVSIARSRKLLLQHLISLKILSILAGFNRSFAKTPSATIICHCLPLVCTIGFNRSFAKTLFCNRRL